MPGETHLFGFRRRCKFGCGAQVARLFDEVGLERQIDAAPFGGDATAQEFRHRLWRFRSKWIGWIPVPYLGKEVSHSYTLYTEHDCAQTPSYRRPLVTDSPSVHIARTLPTRIRHEVARTHEPASTRGPFRRPGLYQCNQVGRSRESARTRVAV